MLTSTNHLLDVDVGRIDFFRKLKNGSLGVFVRGGVNVGFMDGWVSANRLQGEVGNHGYLIHVYFGVLVLFRAPKNLKMCTKFLMELSKSRRW